MLRKWPYLLLIALAAALYHVENDNDVIVVASGGNVDATVFREALERFG